MSNIYYVYTFSMYRFNIQAGNCLLDHVENFKYLGSVINKDGKCFMEIRSRISQVKLTFMNKKKLIFSKNMSIDVSKAS